MLTAFIMAGGSGERFWPLSTKERPKQLLNLVDDKRSMIRITVDRILPLISADKIFIGTNKIQKELIKKELPMIPEENIIIEPFFKDTAAAIGYGVMKIGEKFSNSEVVVLASDHLIKDEEKFREMIKKSVFQIEQEESIMTFGIPPRKAETAYGYIEVEKIELEKVCKVERFLEKPSLERAKFYVESGRYLWNSGIFIFSSNTILKAIEKYLPDHYRILNDIKKIEKDKNFNKIEKLERIKEKFNSFEKISIDFGIMEKAKNIEVMPVKFGWNDIGNFSAFDEILEKNKNGTVCKNSKVVELNSKNNIIFGTGKKLITTIGIEETVIVETENEILVCKKSEEQNIKELLRKMEKGKGEQS